MHSFDVLKKQKQLRQIARILSEPETPAVIYRCVVCRTAEQADRKSRRCATCKSRKAKP